MNYVIAEQLQDIEKLNQASHTARWDCGGLILQMICRSGRNRRQIAQEIGVSVNKLTKMIKGDCAIPLSSYLEVAKNLNTKVN